MGSAANLEIDLGKGWYMYECVCAYRGDQQIFHYLLHSEDLIQRLNPSMTYMNILHINTVQA